MPPASYEFGTILQNKKYRITHFFGQKLIGEDTMRPNEKVLPKIMQRNV